MGEVCNFEDSHISEVESLHLKMIRQQERSAGSDLQKYFGDIFLRNPWCSEDLPSLVYIHDGKVVGFLGVIPRLMTFDGRLIRIATATQFMVETGHYRGVAAMQLLLRFFNGPQDVSYTDGATRSAYELWTTVGAHAVPLYSLEWTRVLNHMEYFCSLLEDKQGMWRAVGRVTAPAGKLIDMTLRRMLFDRFAAPTAEFESEEADANDILETMQKIGWREAVKPHYEPESFNWLIRQTTDARFNGTLRMRIVRDESGGPIGWFVYFAKRGGVSLVMQFGAKSRAMDSVFRALLRDAWNQGSAAVQGQSIPLYLTNFHYQYCFWNVGPGVLVYTRDPELKAAILRGDAALSRLDGEFWLRFV